MLFTLLLAAIVPAAPLEVVRPGDRAMACPALAAEINALTVVQDASAPPRKHRGLLRALGTAANFMPGVALAHGLIGVAAGTAQAGLVQAGAGDHAATESTATNATTSALRRNRLTAIFDEKHC